MRCLIGFFGLSRSLPLTISSIKEHILNPLEEVYDCVRCAHFNQPESIYSPRSGEYNVPSSRQGIEDLKLDICWIEPQREESILAPLLDATGGVDAVGDGMGTSMTNLLYQLYSLQQLWRICQLLRTEQFDMFVLLRPDLKYLDRLPVKQVTTAIGSAGIDLITPSWHRWGGLNDRFAFCSAQGAAVYTDRLRLVRRFVREKGFLHPEALLAFAAELGGVSQDFTAMRAARVRANGREQQEDFSR